VKQTTGSKFSPLLRTSLRLQQQILSFAGRQRTDAKQQFSQRHAG
jgi:hypothetical protein